MWLYRTLRICSGNFARTLGLYPDAWSVSVPIAPFPSMWLTSEEVLCTAVLPMAARNLDGRSGGRSLYQNENIQVLKSYMTVCIMPHMPGLLLIVQFRYLPNMLQWREPWRTVLSGWAPTLWHFSLSLRSSRPAMRRVARQKCLTYLRNLPN